jgi:hypothetical protein
MQATAQNLSGLGGLGELGKGAKVAKPKAKKPAPVKSSGYLNPAAWGTTPKPATKKPAPSKPGGYLNPATWGVTPKPASNAATRPSADYVRVGDVIRVYFEVRALWSSRSYYQKPLSKLRDAVNEYFRVIKIDDSGLDAARPNLIIDVQTSKTDQGHIDDVAKGITGIAVRLGFSIAYNANSPRAEFITRVEENPEIVQPKTIADPKAPGGGGPGDNSDGKLPGKDLTGSIKEFLDAIGWTGALMITALALVFVKKD